jgi:hypothetical protein
VVSALVLAVVVAEDRGWCDWHDRGLMVGRLPGVVVGRLTGLVAAEGLVADILAGLFPVALLDRAEAVSAAVGNLVLVDGARRALEPKLEPAGDGGIVYIGDVTMLRGFRPAAPSTIAVALAGIVGISPAGRRRSSRRSCASRPWSWGGWHGLVEQRPVCTLYAFTAQSWRARCEGPWKQVFSCSSTKRAAEEPARLEHAEDSDDARVWDLGRRRDGRRDGDGRRGPHRALLLRGRGLGVRVPGVGQVTPNATCRRSGRL